MSEALEDADLFILNTCAVTAEAEKKSRQAVARIRAVSPHARIAVCGCAAERAPARLCAKGGGVPRHGARRARGELIDLLASHARGVCIRGESAYGELPAPQSAKSRAFVKIQDGCNNFCSYCIIPLPARPHPLALARERRSGDLVLPRRGGRHHRHRRLLL